MKKPEGKHSLTKPALTPASAEDVPTVPDLQMHPDLLHVLDQMLRSVVDQARRGLGIPCSSLVEQDDPIGLGVESLRVLVVCAPSLLGTA